MYYLIGDIHGMLKNLSSLFSMLKRHLTADDTIIFLGDYIDRGLYSFEVIEFLLEISEIYDTIFLKGNHEEMFLKYLSGMDTGIFVANGGSTTLNSYKKNTGRNRPPDHHYSFFDKLRYYYENEDFVAVHAGLNPAINDINEQLPNEMLWIRDHFYRSQKTWDKTVIFGHTPCALLHGSHSNIYINNNSNIIGIDTGACYGGKLSCLRWPDRKLFQA